jgi:hypothetical protein
MLHRQLSVAQKLKITAMTKARARQRNIAKELGLDVRQVREFQRTSGMPMPTNAIEPALAAKIVELHKAGKPQDEIARELNLNEITVAKYRRAAGLAAHQPGAIAPEVAEQIAARLKRKHSRRRISEELHVTEYQVIKIARGSQA